VHNWKIVGSNDPDTVWECRDDEPLYPIAFCGLVWAMQEQKLRAFRTSDGTLYSPEKYDARQLMAYASDLISSLGGIPRVVESDASPETPSPTLRGVVH
jgi:hypothetical protein